MRIQRRNIKKARIEIIPMIDTIFFLLVFFMISTLSMTQFKGMPVNLPKAASGQQAPAESAAITINKDNRVFLDKQAVDKADLPDLLRDQLAKNPEMLVVINADDGVEHGQVVEVMDIARRANVARWRSRLNRRSRKNERALAGSSFTASSLIHLGIIPVAALVMHAKPIKPAIVPIELIDVPRIEQPKKVEVAPPPPPAPKPKPSKTHRAKTPLQTSFRNQPAAAKRQHETRDQRKAGRRAAARVIAGQRRRSQSRLE